MTCEEYRVLLDDFLDGVIRPEDEEKMLRHEAECPACKELRASLSALQSDLSDLSEDVPPLPEDFHAQWTEKVAALSTEEKPKVKVRFTPPVLRTLAACAVLVLVVGTALYSNRRSSLPVSAPQNAAAPSIVLGMKSEAVSQESDMVLYDAAPTLQSTAMPVEEAEEVLESAAYEEAFEPAEYEEIFESAEGDMPAAFSASERDAGSLKAEGAAAITVPSAAFDETLEHIHELCVSLGGNCSSQAFKENSSPRQTVLEIHIPQSSSDAFLSSLSHLGRVTAYAPTVEDAAGETCTFSLTVSEESE